MVIEGIYVHFKFLSFTPSKWTLWKVVSFSAIAVTSAHFCPFLFLVCLTVRSVSLNSILCGCSKMIFLGIELYPPLQIHMLKF